MAKKMKKMKKAAKRAMKRCAKPAKKKAAKAIKRAAKAMPKNESKKYKELLLKERELIGGDLSHIASDSLNKSQRDASGDLSGYTFHMADVASDNYEMEFSLGRATDEQKLLYRIDEAIRRIKDGDYGLCQQCGKTISKARLCAMPYSELCIDCQTKNERK